MATEICSIPVTEAISLVLEWQRLSSHWSKIAQELEGKKEFAEARVASSKAMTFELCERQLHQLIDNARRWRPE